MNLKYEKKKEFIVNSIYLVIIGLIVYFTLKYGLSMISPFVFAFIISYVLQGPARYISSKISIKQKYVAIILVVLFFGTIGILFSLVGINVISMLTNLFTNLPKNYQTQIEPLLNSLFDGIEKTMIGLDANVVSAINTGFDQIVNSLGDNISNLSLSLVTSLSSLASSLPSFLIKTLLMIISTFFIAADFENITGFITRQFSDGVNDVLTIIKDYIINTLFVVIKSYILIMTITFIELSIGLSIIGVKNAIIIAFVIAIFDILPVLGTGGVMIPWAIITLIQGNITLGIELGVLYIIVTVIRNIIEPRIVGGQLGLHPIVTLISMFVGTSLFGVMGLFGFPIALSLLKYLNDRGTLKLFK